MSRLAIPKPSSLCSARCCAEKPHRAERGPSGRARERRWNSFVSNLDTRRDHTRSEALDGSYQLSVSYEVSVVNIMPEAEPERVTPVQIAMPEYGLTACRADG
jgi:hypothetical protein